MTPPGTGCSTFHIDTARWGHDPTLQYPQHFVTPSVIARAAVPPDNTHQHFRNRFPILFARYRSFHCHCEERSDVAISPVTPSVSLRGAKRRGNLPRHTLCHCEEAQRADVAIRSPAPAGRSCLPLWGRCRLCRRRGPYVPSNPVHKETTDSGQYPTHIDTNISYHISTANSTHIFAFFKQIPNITRSDKKHLQFPNSSVIIAAMQGSYIGNTTASQAVKAGSIPVPCSKNLSFPAGNGRFFFCEICKSTGAVMTGTALSYFVSGSNLSRYSSVPALPDCPTI